MKPSSLELQGIGDDSRAQIVGFIGDLATPIIHHSHRVGGCFITTPARYEHSKGIYGYSFWQNI